MKSTKILGLCLVGFAVMLLAVQPALATKRIYKARLIDPDNRSVSGSSLLGTNATGSAWNVRVFARNVNSTVSEVVISDGSYEILLCSSDPSSGAAEVPCTFDGDGNLDLETTLTSGLLAAWGWSGSEFRDSLDNEEVVVSATYAGGVLSGIYLQVYP